nr:eukaryotic translation initiation factor 4E [Tanacetum cinerariifolium]
MVEESTTLLKPEGHHTLDEDNQPEEREIVTGDVIDTSSSTSVEKHPLEHSWTFWFDNQSAKSKAADWESFMRSIYTFSTVEDFWSLYNNIHKPSKLATGTDFYCFKKEIEPKWEDPVCANGGKWTMTFQKSKSDNPWLYTLLAMIGEQFDHGDDIYGAIVNVRGRVEKISICTKNAANESAQISIGKQWKEFLDSNENIGFIFHDDAKKDKCQKQIYSIRRAHMVNTRTDAELAAAVQNALQTLLPQIRAKIREEFRTGSGPSGSGRNPPPVTILTWLERFNKQKPRSFEKATAPFEGDALAWWKAYKQAKGGDERLKRKYHSIRQTDTETSTEFMQRFLRLAGFLGAAAGTAKEQAKNFQWGLRKSTLNHLMCIPFTDVAQEPAGTAEEHAKNFQWGLRKYTLNYLMCIPFTDVAQVANAARNYEILHERDDDDAERPDKRQKSDRRGGGDNHRSNNNYSGNNNRSSGKGRDQRNRGQQSNRPVNSGFQQSRGPSEGYSYPVCTTCGRKHPGECHQAAGTCFKCGQTGHLQKDCKKNTATSTYGQADKKPGTSGRVFAITEDHATKTSAGHLQKYCKKNTTPSTSGQADKKPGASGRVFTITEGHAANT